MTEKELLAAWKVNKDPAIFTDLISPCLPALRRQALFLCKNTDDAADLLQEVLLKAHKSLHVFHGQSSLATWLYKICRNKAFDMQKARRRILGFELPLTLVSEDKLKSVIEEENPVLESLWAFLKTCSTTEQEIFHLRLVESLAWKELANRLSLNPHTVRLQYHRLLKKLRKECNHEYAKK